MNIAPKAARAPRPDASGPGVLEWVFLGAHGLRTGWSVLFAYCLFRLFRMVVATFFVSANLVDESSGYTAESELTLELIPFIAMLGAGVFAALIEQRRIVDFNLAGPRRPLNFLYGLGAGFAALSALIGALHWGGWLRIGPAALSGPQIAANAALWGCAFLVVGCVEEGLFRCYLQSTLTRGISFWWALAAEIALCLYLFHHTRNNGPWGVYAIALLGLIPCLVLHWKSAARSAFWQAAWVTSTGFGLIHTFNGGENWTGIFAAASMGFVFCVSIRVTGSAWWAIGCHAAWDWAETYFYGAADSGLQARGHFLDASPVGNPLLSGGSDGPEGSLLALGSILLLLALLVIMRRGGKSAATPAATPDAELAADFNPSDGHLLPGAPDVNR